MKHLLLSAALAIASGLAAAQPFTLSDPGSNWLIDYSKYGRFEKPGTAQYAYRLYYKKELAVASGEGIFPNTDSILRDPGYLAVKAKLEIPTEDKGHWAGDAKKAQENFYRWATSKQPEGVKLWFAAESLKEAGMWVPAIKAYYALLVQFPSTTRLSPDGGWGLALGSMAIQRIKLICRLQPQLNLDFVDAEVEIQNPGTLDEKIIRMNPGHFVDRRQTEPQPLASVGVKRYVGEGKVKLVQYNNGAWQLLVNGQPYFVKGMCYDVSKIGQSPDLQNMTPWENLADPDFYKKTWADLNKNGKQDAGENKNDLQLMKEMGVNTLRLYFGATNKQGLRNLYTQAGIRVMMGVAFGAYGLESGGGWEHGTDYTNPQQQQAMLDYIKKTVLEHKDEPYVLMWCLGNENNYGVSNNSNKYPATFAQFLNKAVKLIHKLDPDHPVAYSNGDLGNMEKYARFTPDLDIMGANAYRGKDGMGDMYERVLKGYDKPVIITEFGCPAYTNDIKGENEDSQAEYLAGAWDDIYFHRAGSRGAGNSLGGFVFQWQDEWWKSGTADPVDQHDTSQGQWQGPFADGWAHEEWFGITSQGDGKDSPWKHEIRKAYYTLQKRWMAIP